MTHPGSSVTRHICGGPYFINGEERFCEKDASHEEMTCGPSGEQRGERVVKCTNCGEFTPGVYEAQHNEVLRKLATAVETKAERLER